MSGKVHVVKKENTLRKHGIFKLNLRKEVA
jgi:hypothetical protein